MTTASTSDASELRAWVSRGDRRRAGEWLVRTYAGEVLGLCAAMVRDRAAAEDLTQEVFSAAFAGLDDFRGDASVRTWILAIARNRCIDHLRARKRDPWPGTDEAGPDEQPDEAPLPGDLLGRRDEVEAALAALSEGERALVVLRFRHGLDYPELAAAFGLREGTVRMRISRALRRMREALELQAGAPAMAFDADEMAAPTRAAPGPRARMASLGAGAASRPGAPPAAPPPPAAAIPVRYQRALLAAPPHPLSAFLTHTVAGPSPALEGRLAALVAGL